MNYKKFLESRFQIVDKEGKQVPFLLNSIQEKYLLHDATGYDIILKARQQGFSSLILGMFTADFLLKENSRSVVVADIDDNASELLDRVKFYIKTYEEITKVKVPLKYNSKSELFNAAMNSRYTIGTAKNTEFGRSKTISNLHLSEFAFYPDPQKIIAGAGQAVVETGRLIIETTANGFNDFKKLWDESVNGTMPYNPLFYKASDFYSQEFLSKKRLELKETFNQEYPQTAQEAFLASGEFFFNQESMKYYLDNKTPKMMQGVLYV